MRLQILKGSRWIASAGLIIWVVLGLAGRSEAASSITLSGRIYNLTTGQGYGGVTISLCGAGTTRSGVTGNWQLVVPYGTSYCARVITGLPAGLAAPRTRNNPEIGAFTSYENQVAGVDAYHNPAYPALFQRWDRAIDGGLDFAYAKATSTPPTTPIAAPIMTPPSSPSPSINPSPSPSPIPAPTASLAPSPIGAATSVPARPSRPWFAVSGNTWINLTAIGAVVVLIGLVAVVIPVRAVRRRRYQQYLRSKYYDL